LDVYVVDESDLNGSDPSRNSDAQEAGFFKDPLSLVRDLWDLLGSVDKAITNKAQHEANLLHETITNIETKYKEERDRSFKKECDPIDIEEARKKCYVDYQKKYQDARNKESAPYVERFNGWMEIVNQRPQNHRN